MLLIQIVSLLILCFAVIFAGTYLLAFGKNSSLKIVGFLLFPVVVGIWLAGVASISPSDSLVLASLIVVAMEVLISAIVVGILRSKSQ